MKPNSTVKTMKCMKPPIAHLSETFVLKGWFVECRNVDEPSRENLLKL